MNRRSFLQRFGGLVASVAIAQSVVKSWGKEPDMRFRPEDYRGEWHFLVLKDSEVEAVWAKGWAFEERRYQLQGERFVRVT